MSDPCARKSWWNVLPDARPTRPTSLRALLIGPLDRHSDPLDRPLVADRPDRPRRSTHTATPSIELSQRWPPRWRQRMAPSEGQPQQERGRETETSAIEADQAAAAAQGWHVLLRPLRVRLRPLPHAEAAHAERAPGRGSAWVPCQGVSSAGRPRRRAQTPRPRTAIATLPTGCGMS